MLRACPHCGRIHDSRHRCAAAAKKRRRESAADRWRSTKEWQRARDAVRERDRNMCVWCADEGVVETEGLSVHHVVPLEEDFGKRDDMDNLATLCARHHELAERGEAGRDEIRAMVARQQERFGQSPPG